jgi:hypothetical protein
VLERLQTESGLVAYRSPFLASLGVPHLFTTRVGGPAADLDLGSDADLARVGRLAGRAAAPVVSVRQVHGATVIELAPNALPDPAAEADGLVSARGDVFVAVHVADCVPVLLAREDGRRVAAVHAGWRGLVAGVLPRALSVLGPGRVRAAIGPCLSLARFEVGPEVAAAFEEVGLAHTIHAGHRERPHIDLRAAAAAQLAAGGVTELDTTDRCTYEHAAEFYSYRRDVTHGGAGRTGRLVALIAARRC